jgi:hypothetical protein
VPTCPSVVFPSASRDTKKLVIGMPEQAVHFIVRLADQWIKKI